MRRTIATIVALTIAAPALSGCASLFGSRFSAQSANWVPDQRDPHEYASSQMSLGRDGLRYGQYGLAVIAFRNAERFPEFAADAHNGLGVAYAQIGRPDVARHYFEMAINEAPKDKRYSANLARLDASLADQQSKALAQAAPAAPHAVADARGQNQIIAQFPGNAVRAGLRVEMPADSMQRVSQREVEVGSGTPAAGRRRSNVSAVALAHRPTGRRLNPNYPVTIDYADRKDFGSSAVHVAKKAAYPVHIELDQ
ncbi:hypothetical protein RXV95_08015 [Novosphingobium sp. ZN18A2]|uniref:tetratricopeptide repeat protein n=1 Tax=Novosphingobium sp. ZN18A2 TaxID=3079861 RepID=UPI0030CFE5DB